MSASADDGDASLPATTPGQAAHTTPERPVPRQRKSDAHSAQVQIQNRRREHLQRHPEYLTSIEHELADPILYERLVKRHQSAAEREAEGRAKGYGRTLEADLVRGETKLADLREAPLSSGSQAPSRPTTTTTGIEETWDQPAESKTHGLELWQAFLTNRFVRGQDEEFDYAAVDGNEEYDGLARMEAEEQWFDEEEPARVDDAKRLEGETGVQDF
ncbi:hypothetical protein LMH87_001779 [Akanthomyces muscarius]|uniref:CCD97-like C-terminal domain-containing protein n=1 Tax=Akanthomyces muscarius TaxID=2231603 RepID=A0A9W8Q8A0_AKAMU|nr:hypothetical protein LMH87_001779 [Akanthomyces muscarius]KAJ4147241.1 hypothetical protein LMH87_001779 [Akanthomyces muscarius]